MSMDLKDKIEKDIQRRNITPATLWNIFVNSLNGIKWYAKDGKSIILYIFGLLLEVVMGIIYHISGLEWTLLVCMLTLILSVELINTAIESVCDLITKNYNIKIKIAKDCGSAATFVVFCATVAISLVIFIPKIFVSF